MRGERSSHAEGHSGDEGGEISMRPVRLDARAAPGVLARMVGLDVNVRGAADEGRRITPDL